MQRPSRLMNKNFFLLWQGQAVNRLGLQAYSVAMLFWIKHATDSATIMGLMLMFSSLPAVLLSPLGGALADRVSRRRILVVTDLLSGLAVLALTALFWAAPHATNAILAGLFVVSLGTSILSAFFMPAISAAVPDLVPPDKVAAANSLSQVANQLAIFVGQGLGGVLYRVLGAPLMFLINGFSYLFAALSESFITIPPVTRSGPHQAVEYDSKPLSHGQHGREEDGPPPQGVGGGDEDSVSGRERLRAFGRDILEGLGYVWRTGGLRELVMVSALLSFFTVPFVTLLPFYVEDTLKLSVDWYGYILAAYGIASLAGYALAGLLRLAGSVRSAAVMAALIVSSALYAFIGLVRTEAHALALASLVGVMEGYVMVNMTTLLQVTTPREIRGRVFGVLATIAGALAPLAMGLTGIVTDLAGQNIPLIYMASGALMTGLCILLCASRDLRSFLASEVTVPREEAGPDAQAVAAPDVSAQVSNVQTIP